MGACIIVPVRIAAYRKSTAKRPTEQKKEIREFRASIKLPLLELKKIPCMVGITRNSSEEELETASRYLFDQADEQKRDSLDEVEMRSFMFMFMRTQGQKDIAEETMDEEVA